MAPTEPAGRSKRPDFHPPNPGAHLTLSPWVCQDGLFALGRALSQARLQQANRRRGTDRTSCEPFAPTLDLGERKNPSSTSDLRGTSSVR
jgi:hypothetical protein